MKTVGFPISIKENEKRRALVPTDIKLIRNKFMIYVEEGYGEVLELSDKSYSEQGINICSRSEVLQKDIICDPKVGDAEYLSQLKDHQTIFGWIHAVQNKDLVDILINNKVTCYAWEEMFEDGRHTFYRNNEIAGEAAIMHAYLLFGLFPYETKVAVIGRGNIARGAIKILTKLGADVKVYERKTENLFRKEINEFDVIVNAVLWDIERRDHIISNKELQRMKKGSMIIDISCDRNGGVETSVPTTIEKPIYVVDGIAHYVVDHTPALFYKTITVNLSQIVAPLLDQFIESKIPEWLRNAMIINKGEIIDKKIIKYQNR